MDYGLIGEHLGHSYSAEIHGMIADYEYELKELRPEELDSFLSSRDFKAVNVTIPYKQDVIAQLDFVSDQAKSIGAVNTIVNKEGKLYGYNTDFAGMKALAEKLGFDLNGKKVLILGTGGTSKTARAAAQSMGAAEIFRVSRRESAEPGIITYEQAKEQHSDAAFIINTTPAGMYPKVEGCALDISGFEKLEGVLDAVYNPQRSNLVLDAQERGIPAEGGLYMLSAQAVYACGLFLDKEMAAGDINRAFRGVRAQKQNIVLIGMPSCGKTTIGKKVSRATGRKFIDTDDLVEKRTGMSIADYFAENGEQAFRDIESEVIADVCKEGGLVIATGGGAVLRGENVRAMRRNGRVIFIDRPLERLITTASRPLSSDREALKKRYEERYDIYRGAADVRIKAKGSIRQVTQTVLRAAGLQSSEGTA